MFNVAYHSEGDEMYINPYKPSVLFVGHRQTVKNQIRRRIKRRLIRFSTVYKQKFLLLNLNKNDKIPPNNHKVENGHVQLIMMGKYIRQNGLTCNRTLGPSPTL